MPTGYTHQLQEMKFDTRRWLKECAIRAMGVCVTLRDSGDKSEAQILEALSADATNKDSYHKKALDTATANKKKLLESTEAEIATMAKEFNDEQQKDYLRRKTARDELKLSYEKTLSELKQMQVANTKKDEIIEGTLSFAIQQVTDSIKWDCSEVKKPEVYTPEQFRSEKLKGCDWEINYHTEEMAKESTRNIDRSVGYRNFVNFVNSVELKEV